MTFEEKTLDSEMIYRGAILNLRRDKVTVINGESYREIIEHNGGALVAALTDENKLVMVKQYRKPAGRIMLEVPAGKRDGSESGEEVARRELKEETGYSAKEIVPLGSLYTSPGYSEEVLDMYLAMGLTKGETDFDDNEAIDIEEYPIDELVEMIMKGTIQDGKTQLIILKVMEYLKARK